MMQPACNGPRNCTCSAAICFSPMATSRSGTATLCNSRVPPEVRPRICSFQHQSQRVTTHAAREHEALGLGSQPLPLQTNPKLCQRERVRQVIWSPALMLRRHSEVLAALDQRNSLAKATGRLQRTTPKRPRLRLTLLATLKQTSQNQNQLKLR